MPHDLPFEQDEAERFLRFFSQLYASRHALSDPEEKAINAEDCLAMFRDVSRWMLVKYVDSGLLELATCTYEAGLSGGYYGQRSCVFAGLRARLAMMLWSSRRRCARHRDLLKKIGGSGQAHGELVRSLDGAAH
ncbi:hypothetical protein WL93_00090 [Burkholderia diffusa]|uniref:hypothetical protein n=1 Tax=Burkholderia diffusa TaxID=488732 RepID=UPI00075C86EB|nr:hypothetical protein [Burkholderia diffusa]KWF95448.1 hypothetical protein WL93_00090 [Burkholderia diffusa]